MPAARTTADWYFPEKGLNANFEELLNAIQ